jgi:peptide/nickel transport system ATP-binding protein
MTNPASSPNRTERLLDVRRLSVSFPAADNREFHAVHQLSFHINNRETVAIVGESGCGKSVTAFSIMRLLQKPGRISAGEIFFNGKDLLLLPERDMRALRGAEVSMVFQEPMTALNPVLKTGFQVTEAILQHQSISRKDAAAEAVNLLAQVGIPSPAERYHSYPHQLSGGMKQRAMIAMALASSPKLLIADEPTTALDVTIQAQILELIDDLKQKIGMSLLLITHNLGIVAERADRTIIMYAGSAVESATTRQIIEKPQHPYTQALLASLPQYGIPGEPLPVVGGTVTAADRTGSGCPFAGRCPFAIDICTHHPPQLIEITPGHAAACWRAPFP